MRRVELEISTKQADAIIQSLQEKDIMSDEFFEGSLVDNYFYTDMKGFKWGRYKTREYMIILEHYLNCWSSDQILIMTDSAKEYNELLEYSKLLEQYEKEDEETDN